MAFYSLDLSLTFSNLRVSEEARGIRISIQLQLDGTDNFLEISQTETIFDMPSGQFKQNTTVPYRFNSSQLIKFVVLRVVDDSERLAGRDGEARVSLASLVCSAMAVQLRVPGVLELTASLRVPSSYCDYIRLSFAAHHLKPFNNYQLAAYFIFVLVAEKRSLLLHASEVIRCKEAHWAPFRVSAHAVESGSLQLHVFNHNPNGQDSLIGYLSTTLSQLLKGAGPLNTYMLMDCTGTRRGEKIRAELTNVERDTGPSFFDIMRSGCELRPVMAVDLTASNGSPLDPASLHYIHAHRPGSYALSVTRHLTPLAQHSRDARISALGFGAKIPPNMTFSNCFPLLPNSETVMGVEGALEAYRRRAIAIQPFGPTQYADVIYHVSNFAKASQNLQMRAFFVLLIFTNGARSVCSRTLDALVDLSPHPAAVFFVAVGSGKELASLRKAESHPLVHSDGRLAARQVAVVIEEGDDSLSLLPPLIAQWKNLYECSLPA